MTVFARTRVMLVVFVAVLGLSMWVIAGDQRGRLLRAEGQVAGAGDLLTAMLEQETGLRGYGLTGLDDFLEPYRRGRHDYAKALHRARERAGADAALSAELRAQAATVARWQALAEDAIARVDAKGAGSLRMSDTRERKTLMDQFRRANAGFRELVRRRAAAEVTRARWTATGLVVLLGFLALGSGLLTIERSARRAARRRRIDQEFIETLQGADDETEAQELLRLHVERSVHGVAAVVLSRAAGGNDLTPSTDAASIGGLADRLDAATPRDCLAVRRGTIYSRGGRDEPLQACGICGVLPGASQCTPSIVGGEVIGSLLVTRSKPIRAADQVVLAGAVTQAAPVLANLRNLAIAEHRAATDGLTGLPNARAVRETLTRMVAQAGRSVAPLSVIALDLDHFKALNDHYGHQAGDDMLAAVGAALADGLRTSDFAGRWGGEEFLALLPDTDIDGAAAAAAKLRELVATITVPSVPGGVTASLGVASLPRHAHGDHELLRAADRALYAAKAAGRDRVVIAGADAVPAT